jgi:hypothetical protein
MLALLALIPNKDKLYIALVLALVSFGAYEYFHLQAEGARRQAAADAAADAKVAQVAIAQKAKDDADYAARAQQLQESYNADIARANAASDDLTRRLRIYEARRCPVLPSAPAAPTAGAAAPDSVGEAIEALIRAAEHDLVVLGAERAERDSLTGK